MGNAIQTVRMTFLNEDPEKRTEVFQYIKNERRCVYRRIYFINKKLDQYRITFKAKHNDIYSILQNISLINKKDVIKIESISNVGSYTLFERRNKNDRRNDLQSF